MLIDAFLLSKEIWRPQIEALTKSKFRLILPDLLGFGDHLPMKENFTIVEIAREIASIFENLRIKKAIIGVFLIGGYVAQILYHEFPELYAAMVLADTTHLADTDEKRAPRFELISLINNQGTSVLREKMQHNIISDDTKNK